MKKSYKKVYALYLSVAFFFVFFSFGINQAHAALVAEQPSTANNNVYTTYHSFVSLWNYQAPNSYYGVSGNSDYWVTVNIKNDGTGSNYVATLSDGASTCTASGNRSDIVNSSFANVTIHLTGCSALATVNPTVSAFSFKILIDGATSGTSRVTYTSDFVSGIGEVPYFQLYTTDPDVPADATTRFTSFTVNQSAGTVLATGYWTASATSSQSQELRFWQVSPVLGQESYASRIATTTGNFSFTFPYVDSSFQISATSTSYTLGSGTTFHAEIYQLYDGFNPFNQTGTPPLLLTSTSTQITATSTVTVDSSDPRSLSGLPEPADCGLSAITGCIKNAAVWLFYPSSDSVDSFKGLSDTLSGKFPFAYAYGINAMRLELFEAAQTSTTTISLNFKIIPGHATSTLTLLSPTLLSNVPYSSTVKTILGWILWLLGVEYIYYRVLRSHDPNTP